MILKFLMRIIIFIIGGLMQIAMPYVPTIDMANYIADFLDLISDFMGFGFNFLYFIFGQAVFAFLSFITGILFFKYIIFPILVIIRRIFIKGGDQ